MPTTRVASPFYVDKSLGGAFSSLADLVAGDGGAGLSRDAANYASARLHDAQTAKTLREAAMADAANAARGELGSQLAASLYRNVDTSEPVITDPGIAAPEDSLPSVVESPVTVRRPATPQEMQAALPEIVKAGVAAYPDKPGGFGASLAALLPLSGDDTLQRQALIIGGHSPNKDFAGNATRADAISARDAAEQQQLEGVRQTGANARNAATIAGENERARMTDDRNLVPSVDPETGNVVWVKKSEAAGRQAATAPANQKDKFVVSPNADGGYSYELAKPGLAAPTPAGEREKAAKTVKMGPRDAQLVAQQVAADHGLDDGQYQKIVQTLSPEERAGLAKAIEQGWNEGGGNAANAAAAAGNYFASLGKIVPGTTFMGIGSSSRLERSAPAATAAPGGVPQRPQALPAGSQYSPSRRMWRTPDGKLFDETGKPVS